MAMKPRGIIALALLVGLALAASVGTILAADPPPAAPKTPTAKLKIVAVAANPADSNVIEATLSDGKTISRTGATGLPNVSVGVPVTLSGGSADSTVQVSKYTWTLSKPTASKATLIVKGDSVAKFTPDVSGTYKVDLVVGNDSGASPMASLQIRAGEYIGTGLGNCFQCHPQKTQEWSETPHAGIMKREINGGEDPAISHYGEGCLRCHTTGYNAGVNNGGFAAVQAATGWKFPDLKDIQAGKDNFGAMPEGLQNMANIQCEDCHGPAKDHVTQGAKMASSLDEGVCNVCHDGGGHHVRGALLRNAKHDDATSQAFTYPTGPSRQDCVRCHSGSGYISFLANPRDKGAWDNSVQTVSCAVCHDPHSEANDYQLRITGKPVEVVGITKDFGLSTTCVECHNGRVTAADAQKGSYPHYSAAAEMLSDTGGVTYGRTVPNSAHGMVVGKFPVAGADGALLYKGNEPGPCVQCHMAPAIFDAKDPNYLKVGEHSVNMSNPEGTFDYTTSCTACHGGITSFNLPSKADYDGNGKVEGVQEEVAGLVKTLQKALADSGIRPIEGNPYFNRDDLAKANEKQKNAIYNYRFVRGLEGRDGKDNAIHNFKRSVALIQFSYKDLTGKDVPNATLIQ